MGELIFVYNKDSGFMNGIFDFFHKMMSPKSYTCSLCRITYNYIGMRLAWKSYLNSLPVSVSFYHKDEFKIKYPDIKEQQFPKIFYRDSSVLKTIVTKDELEQADLTVLIKKINTHVKSCRI